MALLQTAAVGEVIEPFQVPEMFKAGGGGAVGPSLPPPPQAINRSRTGSQRPEATRFIRAPFMKSYELGRNEIPNHREQSPGLTVEGFLTAQFPLREAQ